MRDNNRNPTDAYAETLAADAIHSLKKKKRKRNDPSLELFESRRAETITMKSRARARAR